MRLDPLGTLTLTYSHLTELSYEAGGQVYGALEGTIEGGRTSRSFARDQSRSSPDRR